MSLKVQSFTKKKLTQDEIAKLCIVVSTYCKNVTIAQLANRLNMLDNAIAIFQAMIHPVPGSELTPEILEADDYRDSLVVGFAFYLEFALRHTDPAMVRAAKELKVVLDTPSYKQIYDAAYNRESNLIANLIEELKGNHLNALNQLNILFYIDALETANNNFDALYAGRVKQTARSYDSADILKARTNMEKAFDMLCSQLEILAADAELAAATGMGGGAPAGGTGMGGTTTLDYAFYENLFNKINEHITGIVSAASHRITMVRAAKEKKKEDADNGGGSATPETPTNTNEGGENTGGNNNTGGEDNTPSANA